MSVATRTRTWPDRNAARLRLRVPWARSPWSSAAGAPAMVQLTGEPGRSVLGPGEDQHAVVAAGQGGDHGHPVGRGDGQQMMDDLGGRGGIVDRVPGRLGQETPGEDVHGTVEGGREQQPLALGRGGVEQPPHDRQEAQVGHVIRFVDHADLDIAEVAVVLLDQVGQPPRAGYDDIGAVAQGSYLRILRDAAEDGGDGQSHGVRQRRQDRVHLGGQLAGRHQHQAARAAGHRCTRRPAGRRAGWRTRASCPSRSGPGRGCRRRPARRAAWRPGRETGP